MHWIYAHLIGDYLIQNDWMAKGKKVSSWICLVHVLTYLLPFLLCGLEWWKIAAIGVQHFAQDRTGVIVWVLNNTGKADFAKPPMAPWSIIVTDNIIHILFIVSVVNY